MTNLIPIGNKILVQPIVEEQKTTSGLILPTKDKSEAPTKGKVVSIGNGIVLENGERAPIDVFMGDVVHFAAHSPDEVEFEGSKYLIVDTLYILAVERAA